MKYTYFFYSSETGLTKIGRTRFPQQRFNQLGGKSKLHVIGLIEGDREAEMHESYSDYRDCGEWFLLNGTQLREIKAKFPIVELPQGKRTDSSKKSNPRPKQNLVLKSFYTNFSHEGLTKIHMLADLLEVTPQRAMEIFLVEAAKQSAGKESA